MKERRKEGREKITFHGDTIKQNRTLWNAAFPSWAIYSPKFVATHQRLWVVFAFHETATWTRTRRFSPPFSEGNMSVEGAPARAPNRLLYLSSPYLFPEPSFTTFLWGVGLPMPPQSQVCQKIFSYNASHLFTESSPLQDRRDREQLLTHCPQSPKVTAERSVFLARWSSWTWPFSASEPTGGGSLCDRPRETPSQARWAVGDTGSNSG